MASRRSKFSSKKKNPRNAALNQPESAEEFLEAGVELEEAGEKWRAGDSAKALRFFTKAIAQYETGLRAFPTSFDLAYNKARLQYEITEQPQLLRLIAEPRQHLLNIARSSHILAWQLDNRNTDVLFNLGQVCSSLADLIEASEDTGAQHDEVVQLLQQAVGAFESCLEIQEEQFKETQLFVQGTSSAENESSFAADVEKPNPQEMEEVWASVVEPLTEADLFDTCLAILEALRLLCQTQFNADENALGMIERVSFSGVREKLELYAHSPDQKLQSAIALSSLLAAQAELRFRLGVIAESQFEAELQAGAGRIESIPGFTTSGEALVALGETHLDYNLTIDNMLETGKISLEQAPSFNRSRWEQVTRALDFFTAASKLPDVPNLARIHVSRGDCELSRARLGDRPYNYEFAIKSQDVLLRNAGIYYRAALKVWSNRTPESPEDLLEVEFKVSVVGLLERNEAQPLLKFLDKGPVIVTQRLIDIGRQGLVGEQMSARIQQVLQGRMPGVDSV